jgi:CheY-like chemotaxis protein
VEGEFPMSNELSNRRVLVVEDESMVSMLLEDMLAEMGWEVIGLASRFKEASEKANSLSFDVAILDVNLNGDQTYPIAEDMVKLGHRFVFATGYGPGTVPPAFDHVPVLHKPFQLQDLARVLNAALA